MDEQNNIIDNRFVAFFASVIVLTFVGIVAYDYWLGLFSMAVSWVLSDVVLNLLIEGGGGIVHIPILSGVKIVTKGRAYLGFLTTIFLATWLSSVFTDVAYRLTGFAVFVATTGMVTAPQMGMMAVFVSSLIAGVLVFLDLNARYYDRPES